MVTLADARLRTAPEGPAFSLQTEILEKSGNEGRLKAESYTMDLSLHLATGCSLQQDGATSVVVVRALSVFCFVVSTAVEQLLSM